MLDCNPSCERANELLQRRWFATQDALKTLEAKCDLLLEVLKLSDRSWRDARAQLAELRAIRDGLEEELDALHGEPILQVPRAAASAPRRDTPQAARPLAKVNLTG